ncbi:DNA binding domain, excisionase family [Butyrivibrio fibrisolvens 16/4]|nr:DNA binding domain, excisionase family [Butyrivibrio fibrisolvens 16/4]
MNTYSVKEISEMLGTNPETVRRWIREGKLEATQESRKDGNTVSEANLQKFLESTPKYAGLIAGGALAMGVPIVGAALAVLGGVAVGASSKKMKQLQDNVSSENIISYLNEEIEKHQVAIEEKKKNIKKIEMEIKKEEAEISNLKKTLFALKSSINNK